jgi:hypothetical protein
VHVDLGEKAFLAGFVSTSAPVRNITSLGSAELFDLNQRFSYFISYDVQKYRQSMRDAGWAITSS